MFSECPQLEEIRVGNKEIAQYILDHLSQDCIKARVYVGDSKISIEDEINPDFPSFKYDDKYQDIDIKKANELLDSENFEDGVLTIPENFNGRIINEAFADNESIRSVNTNNISTICEDAFKKCTELTEVLGNSVTKVEESAFSSCKNLNKVNFFNVNKLCSYAFLYCKNLTEVNIPNVNKIESACFSGCENLVQIENLQNVCEVGYCAFEKCKKLQQINLPLVTKIDFEAFAGCAELQQITIPLVTKIERKTFKGCIALRQIDLPSVIDIMYNAFEGCTTLERVSIPNIEKFDSDIFNGCENLNEIVTTTAEQCRLIFDRVGDALQRKIRDGGCNLLCGDEVWDSQAYIQRLEGRERLAQERLEQERLEQERLERERLEMLIQEFEARRQENKQMFDNLIESLKTPKEKIRKGEPCSVCLEEFNDSESDNFVCTMHEDPSSGIQHQIHKNCLIGLLKSKSYICPICRADLEISEEVKEAIEELVYLEEHNNN